MGTFAKIRSRKLATTLVVIVFEFVLLPDDLNKRTLKFKSPETSTKTNWTTRQDKTCNLIAAVLVKISHRTSWTDQKLPKYVISEK